MTGYRGWETPTVGLKSQREIQREIVRDGGWFEVPGFLPRDGLPCTRLMCIHGGPTQCE